MDYTKVPRALIYKDRDDLDNFPVIERFDPPQMEARFLDALEQRPFIKKSYDAPELILQIFNNARYITTLIRLENHPNHYLHKYLAIAGSNNRNITIANHVVPATMALVRNYLCNYFTGYIGSKIVEDITNHFNTDAWKDDTIGGQDDFYKLFIGYTINNEIVDPSSVHPLWISDDDFRPRDIKETINDPLFTARDISENIDYILNTLQNSVEIFDEEIEPLNNMYKKVESWFPSGIDDNLNKELALDKIETRLKKLDPHNAYGFLKIMNNMEKSLHNGTPISSKSKEEIDKYMKETLGVGIDEIEAAIAANQDDTENSPKDRISELEDQVDKLKKENTELKERHHLSQEKDEGEDDEKEVEKLKEVLELDKILEDDNIRLQIDERIIFVSTALGVPWNSDMTNQTQLAKIIENFSGDNYKSIRSRIVAINKEIKEENKYPGEGLSQGTKEAVNNVIGWLKKASKGDLDTPATEALIEEIKDVFLNSLE